MLIYFSHRLTINKAKLQTSLSGAIMAIYDLVMWLVNNMQRIMSLVHSVVSSVTNIASGNIGGAAGFIENAMAKTIPMILSGLAQSLNRPTGAQRAGKIYILAIKFFDKTNPCKQHINFELTLEE